MKNEQRQGVWLAAYNAALTGFLAHGLTVDQARELCQRAAGYAVEDYEKRWHPDSGPAQVQVATVGAASRPLGRSIASP